MAGNLRNLWIKKSVGAMVLPIITAPTHFPGERSPHSFPESCAHKSAPRNVLKRGRRSKDEAFSGEDEKLAAYYHNEKKFFLAIQTRLTKIADACYQPPLRGRFVLLIPNATESSLCGITKMLPH
jgi:hypothetical protein